MISDCHMHTHFSVDSDVEPEKMVLGAIEKGLKAICFTDHEDKDFFEDGKEMVIDMERYIPTVLELRERYHNQIEIRLGVEIGVQPHLGAFFQNFTESSPFDYVIGSAHTAGGKDPYFSDFFEGRTDRQGYEFMFEEMLKGIRAVQDFDALGHLDYVVRYGRTQEKEYSYAAFADQIDMILRFLIEHGKGLELNTAGLKYGLPFAHPHPDVLKRYRELGGEIITIGSDAHRPEHIAYAFDCVEAILTGCGFKYFTEFNERKPVFRKIL